MKQKVEKALNRFMNGDNDTDLGKETIVDKKKIVKSDNSIIERIDKIIIAENGKQLLREQY